MLDSGFKPVLKIHRGEICYLSTEDDQSFGMWCPVTPDIEHNFNEGEIFFIFVKDKTQC
jgi:hypothetical protein